MKAILIIIAVAFIHASALAQQTDSAGNKNSTQVQQEGQPVQDPANDAQGKVKQKTDQSSPTNQGNPVPRGDSQIQDGTNAIPIDSSRKQSHHGVRKKTKRN